MCNTTKFRTNKRTPVIAGYIEPFEGSGTKVVLCAICYNTGEQLAGPLGAEAIYAHELIDADNDIRCEICNQTLEHSLRRATANVHS
jgi:ribosomal protein S27E